MEMKKSFNQENINLNNYLLNTMNSIKFNNARMTLQNSVNTNNLKTLTLNILDLTKPIAVNNYGFVNDVEKCIEEWAESILIQKNPTWQNELVEYCKQYQDILEVYILDNSEFAMIIEDIANNNIFKYNDFCFQLAEKYEGIINFMVIDEEEASGSHDLLQDYKLIYKKG